MSGHSHFKTIKRVKDANDARRGKIFSKMARAISVAAREGGPDPDKNSKLKMVIEQARSFNCPKDNIERAIKKGTGELAGEKLEEFVFEAYGPGNIAIIVEGITDNTNRSLSEVRQILHQHNGKLANAGSVQWLFEKKGVLRITNEYEYTNEQKEAVELKVIETGAEDMHWEDNILEIYTKPGELEKVKNNLEQQEIKIESASLEWVAKDEIEAQEKNKQAIEKLFEVLDENDDVQEIYSNLKV